MGKHSTKSNQQNGNEKTITPYSSQESQLFFNQRSIPKASEIQKIENELTPQQPAQEINLETPTEKLLAAILQELRTQNMLTIMQMKIQQGKEQEELQEIEEQQKKDDERFEKVHYSMYS